MKCKRLRILFGLLFSDCYTTNSTPSDLTDANGFDLNDADAKEQRDTSDDRASEETLDSLSKERSREVCMKANNKSSRCQATSTY